MGHLSELETPGFPLAKSTIPVCPPTRYVRRILRRQRDRPADRLRVVSAVADVHRDDADPVSARGLGEVVVELPSAVLAARCAGAVGLVDGEYL